jgi:putative spermidine/putrescine transport system ATP-binding protein
MSLVEIRGLSKAFGDRPVFSDIDLDIDEGEICVLVGPSGCGKTTLLRAVAGLTAPDSGSIRIGGADMTGMPPQRRGISMVFQHYALFPNMTVERNLAFALEQQSADRRAVRQRVAEMIRLMGLEDRATAKPAALSGGQKQRVALARALVTSPKLLLLDEPMSALDAQIRKRLREELRRLQAEIGFTALFVTHDQEEALVLGDRIAVMHGGRIARVGGGHEVYHDPRSRTVAAFFGDINVMEPAAFEAVFGYDPGGIAGIHPGSLVLSVADPHVAPPQPEGHVRTVQMLGSVVRYGVDVQGTRLKVDVLNRPADAPLTVGAAVHVGLHRESVRVLQN